MSKLDRLTKRSQFTDIAKKGDSIATKGIVLQYIQHKTNLDNTNPQVGFTVTKRVGNAVVRNRIKRRLRALAREILSKRAVSGYDYVLIGRVSTLKRPYIALQKDLKYALHQVHSS